MIWTDQANETSWKPLRDPRGPRPGRSLVRLRGETLAVRDRGTVVVRELRAAVSAAGNLVRGGADRPRPRAAAQPPGSETLSHHRGRTPGPAGLGDASGSSRNGADGASGEGLVRRRQRKEDIAGSAGGRSRGAGGRARRGRKGSCLARRRKRVAPRRRQRRAARRVS